MACCKINDCSVVLCCIVLLLCMCEGATSSASVSGLPFQCSVSGHRILGNPFRSVSYTSSGMSGELCDKTLVRGWYQLQIFGKNAEMPTECVQVNQCGTDSPMWLDSGGRSLPAPGESARHMACATWSLGNQRSMQDCCLYSFPVTVTNCVDFFVYYLMPARGCNMAYCATEGRAKCSEGQLSLDGFAPCRDSFPSMSGIPTVTPVILEDVLLKCSFQGADSSPSAVIGYTVSWNKVESDGSVVRVSLVDTFDTFDNFAYIDPKDYFHMGDEIVCSVQAFFNNTRNIKSDSVQSQPFKATIKVSPSSLEIAENGQPHFLVFESSMPISCRDKDRTCSVRVVLTTINNDVDLDHDIVLSECFIDFQSHPCVEPRCRQAMVLVTAVTDFTQDGRRNSVIVTGAVTSSDPFWDGFDPADVEVVVNDVITAQCYAFTEPHFITFDRKKYDFYKTGTYVLIKSLAREFEVHSRIWSCGGSTQRVSCICGFVARENNDIISVDMCNGNIFETTAEVQIRSALPLSDGVKIKEARNATKITIEFSSGAFVRADIADWGMSITVQAPSVDFNRTVGLCGKFDGDPDNDFHDDRGQPMNVVIKYQQANEFVEQWRLRDGGMFNALPMTVPFPLHIPSCTCSLSTFGGANSLFSSEDLECIDDSNCMARCTKNKGVMRGNIVQSLDMTSMYNNALALPWEQRIKRSGASRDGRSERFSTFQSGSDVPQDPPPVFSPGIVSAPLHDMYFFYPDHSPTDLRPVTPQWPTATGITEQQAGEICETFVRSSSLGLACGVDNVKTDRFIQDTVDICIGDIQMTDDIFWFDQSLALLENQCEAAVVSDRTLWRPMTSGVAVPPEEVVKALNCPRNCSHHGVCSELGCICLPGYSSHDCSRSDADFPELLRLENNGLCDWQSQSCQSVRVMGRSFQEGQGTECHLRLIQNNNSNKSAVYKTRADYINKRTVLCHLPAVSQEGSVGKHLARWEVKVAYTGTSSVSSGLVLTVYDSTCQTCDWKGQCQMKASSCLVESTCYLPRQISPANHCHQCLPNEDQYNWSLNTENQPPIPEGTPPLTYFVGDVIRHQIVAIDSEGSPVVYSIVSQDKASDIAVTPDGTLTWLATTEGDFSFTITLTDQCGASSTSTIQIHVVQCGCRNGGRCLTPRQSNTAEESNQADLPEFTCDCPPHYTGTNCEISRDGCAADPCVNGRCEEDNAVFGCRCDEGYTGRTCSTLTDSCANRPCYPGVACTLDAFSPLSFACSDCPSGYTGDGIECQMVASQCQWGCPRRMRCDPIRGCVCQEGYAGHRCHQVVCNPPCYNNGFCIRSNNECVCPIGYSGPSCETVMCTVNCENGGYCITPDTCKCPDGYTGPRCNIAVCQPLCRNGGTCVRPGNCVCLRGFQGSHCQTAICSPSCQNGGSCVRLNMCLCLTGYTGNTCAVATCEPRCQNGGRCVKPNVCSCPSGYRGRKCHRAICVSGCLNGGDCIKPNVCTCKAGYTGSRCQTFRANRAKAVCRTKCMYGGRCVGPNTCRCRSGYEGDHCQHRITQSGYRRNLAVYAS